MAHGALGLTALFFAGSLFTWIFVLAWAALLGVGARLLATKGSLFLTQLVGAVLCLSIFQDVRYMFSEGGVVGGVAHRSDSAAIADALLLPYWFWGGVVLAYPRIVVGSPSSPKWTCRPAPMSMLATAAWIGGTAVTLTFPDLSGVAGWNAAWATDKHYFNDYKTKPQTLSNLWGRIKSMLNI